MTTFREQHPSPVQAPTSGDRLSLAGIVELLSDGRFPVRFTAYDGSATGPPDSEISVHLATPRGATYVFTAPGDLGMARAYIAGDLQASGVHPGDPYVAMRVMADELHFRRPTVAELALITRSLGWELLRPVPPPPQESRPRWRRVIEGLAHSRQRDSEAIHHHYDVSNRFYEMVLGPSMTYTCAVFEHPESSLEEAQERKHELIADKLGLQAGMRLLDIGCGWGGMVRYAARRGVRALGVTLSAEQARWAQQAIDAEGLTSLAEVRHLDYRDAPGRDYDAISSIGLTEHVGVHTYPTYFAQLLAKLRLGGRLLNHCITVPDNRAKPQSDAFIDRYVFPDGELAGAGKIITEAQNAGFEVRHVENLREHYALTLKQWNANLVSHWDECVAEVGVPTARVWGLYMASSRLAFERNGIELHQVLAVCPDATGNSHVPLRPWWR
ncbi:MAG: cyclopropane-fatty-acyl-phospholipid synthase [Pseudonocardiales bacterium]|jgi:cyclopropane-fatty-acyl-phospholipid synthase|nr:cyclopropane-fatty-acyl-phospholipid synthase [Pseudonocardiales bacterium]